MNIRDVRRWAAGVLALSVLWPRLVGGQEAGPMLTPPIYGAYQQGPIAELSDPVPPRERWEWSFAPTTNQKHSPLIIDAGETFKLAQATEGTGGQGMDPDSGASGGDVAAQFTNPTAMLTSYQFVTQYNPVIEGTSSDGVQFLFRPVIPIPKSDLIPLNQIVRAVGPVASDIDVSTAVAPEGQLDGGFGDVQLFDLFILPISKELTLGVGPVAIFPTATSPTTGQGYYQLGPAGVVLYSGIPKWQLGILAQELYSLGGVHDNRPSVHQMIYQPIITRHFEKGWYAGFCGQPAVIDWRADYAQFPAGVGLGRVFPINGQLVNLSVSPTYYVGAEEFQSEWQVQFNVALIYGK